MAVTARETLALSGIAAAAVSLGTSALVAVPFGAGADSRTAVGSTVIDLTPGPAKGWAIQKFGTNHKLFLAVAGSAAVLSRPGASIVDVIPTLIGAACGIAVLRFLTSGRVADRQVVPRR